MNPTAAATDPMFVGAVSIDALLPRAQQIVTERLEPWTIDGHDTRPAIWTCQVLTSVPHTDLPPGCDLPMRHAVEAAAREVTSREVLGVSSGWGDRLDEGLRAAHERRLPVLAEVEAEVLARVLCLPSGSVIRKALGV